MAAETFKNNPRTFFYNLSLTSDQVFGPMIKAAHQDGRFQLNMSGAELTVSTSDMACNISISCWVSFYISECDFQELFKTNLTSAMPEFIRKVTR